MLQDDLVICVLLVLYITVLEVKNICCRMLRLVCTVGFI
jgi:hypothetical protein